MLVHGVTPHITKEDIELPAICKGQLAFLLHNVLTEEVGGSHHSLFS